MSKNSGTTTSVRELSPEQRQLLNLVIPVAEETIQNPPELFPKSTIAGFDPLQELGQRIALDTAINTILPTAQTAAEANQFVQGATLPISTTGLGELIQGIGTTKPASNFLLSGALLNPETNPALQGEITAAIRPIQEQLTTQILPNIRNAAVGAGQFGGSRQGVAEGLAVRDFLTKSGDVASNIASRNFQQGLEAMTRTLDTVLGAGTAGVRTGLGEGVRSLFATPELTDLLLQPAQVVSGVGDIRRALEQAKLSEEADRFMTEQLIPFLVAQDVANLAFGIPAGKSITSQGSNIGPLETALGFLGPLATIVGGIL